MEKALTSSLLMTSGPNAGTSYPLTLIRTTIGRDSENAICVVDHEVSRFHCTISIESGQAVLTDQSSANGTIVNGHPIQEFVLQRGDQIQVGQSQFVFDRPLEIADTPDLSELTGTFSHSDIETLMLEPPSEAGLESTVNEFESNPNEREAERRFIRAHNDLRFIYDASLTTSRNVDTPKMLCELLDLIFEWIQADRGCVMLTDQQGTEFSTTISKLRSGPCNSAEIQVNQAIIDYVCQQKVGILSPNPMVDRRWRSESDPGRPMISDVLCVPIQGQRKLLGVIYVDTLQQSTGKNTIWLREDHLRMMLAIAHQAAVAIENKSYFTELIEKEKMKSVGETTEMMSHQINNILQGISGGSHLVEMGLAQDDTNLSRKGWEIVRRNQEQISQMLLDLVFLSKPFDPNRTRVDLTELVSNAVDQFHQEIIDLGEQPMSCPIQSKSRDGDVSVDSQALVTAIVNLLKVIQLASSSIPDPSCLIAVTVSDHGARVELHYRGNRIPLKTNQRLESGVEYERRLTGGIGLEVSRKIARAHHGDISVSSESPESNQIAITFSRNSDGPDRD